MQVQDHRNTSASSSSSTSVNSTKIETNVPFSIHNYNQYLTSSPYVPFQPVHEESKASGDTSTPAAPSADASASKDKQASRGPNVSPSFSSQLLFQSKQHVQSRRRIHTEPAGAQQHGCVGASRVDALFKTHEYRLGNDVEREPSSRVED